MSRRRVYSDTPRSRGVLDAISHHSEGVWKSGSVAGPEPSPEYRRAYAATRKRVEERQRREIPQLTPAFRVGDRVFVVKHSSIHQPEVVPQKLRQHAEAGFVDAAGKFYARLEVAKEFGVAGESMAIALVRERRKSSSSGGEVEVSGYERDGHPVSPYTRSKPK